ncbi:unnamed protein product, partial [Amoebophrya sp. A25]
VVTCGFDTSAERKSEEHLLQDGYSGYCSVPSASTSSSADFAIKLFPPVFLASAAGAKDVDLLGSVFDEGQELVKKFDFISAATTSQHEDYSKNGGSSTGTASTAPIEFRHRWDTESGVIKIELQARDVADGRVVLFSQLFLPVWKILQNVEASGQSFLTLWMGIDNQETMGEHTPRREEV